MIKCIINNDIDIIKDRLETLEKKAQNQPNVNSINNGLINSTINNIVINTLGNENLAKLTHNEIDRIFDDEINGAAQIENATHFHILRPQGIKNNLFFIPDHYMCRLYLF